MNMIKNIIVQASNQISTITEYFDFNQISYLKIDLWDTKDDEFGGYRIPTDLLKEKNNLLIVDYLTFETFFNWHISLDEITKFSKNNRIWVWNNADGLINTQTVIPLILKNNEICQQNISLFIDGSLLIDYPTLNIHQYPVNKFINLPRVHLGALDKKQLNYDFLLTTIIKRGREHRDILCRNLASRSIYKQGIVSLRSADQKYTQWLGHKNHQHIWQDGHPSMDLYLQCCFEIVPETLCQHGYFYTEKTNKPIATKTPFLTVSTKGYLEYLRSLGFKTFDSLIDESYDQQDTIEDRVRLMLDQAEDIIANGSEQFYNSAKPILDHNYNHLAELSGKWNHLIDEFITQQLERIGFKL